MKRRRIIAPLEARHVLAYVRVSTEDQADNGSSLAAQEARLRAYAASQGLTLQEVIVDAGVSAKDLRRPGFERIMSAIETGAVGTLVVCKLDRATRSVGDLCNLLDLFERHNVTFVSLSESMDTGSPTGRLMVHLLATIAEFERRVIGERTEQTLTFKRRSRSVYSHIAFGWRRDGDQIVPHAAEQTALETLRTMREAGASLQRCADWLTSNAHKPAQRATRWYPQTVKDILESRIATESE